jgi:hypothetical protein
MATTTKRPTTFVWVDAYNDFLQQNGNINLVTRDNLQRANRQKWQGCQRKASPPATSFGVPGEVENRSVALPPSTDHPISSSTMVTSGIFRKRSCLHMSCVSRYDCISDLVSQ